MSHIASVFLGTVVYLSAVWVSPVESENYFGVAFSPYVKPSNPLYDSYTIEEIKQMLKIILNYHNSVATYSMGAEGYNNGKPWDQCDSNALIARAAAQINKEKRSLALSVSQGIFQKDDANVQKREIDNAFAAAKDANGIFGGTVWGLIFTNEFVTNSSNGPQVLEMIRNNKLQADSMGLKVGTRVQTCGDILGGPNQNILRQIAQVSDFIMCDLYPKDGAINPEAEVEGVGKAYRSAKREFLKVNPNLEVQIGETGWASAGVTFNNAVNTVDNMRRFWNGMKDWATNNKVKVHMFEAFDEYWKKDTTGEKHFGWWNRPDDDQARYVEKATGQFFE